MLFVLTLNMEIFTCMWLAWLILILFHSIGCVWKWTIYCKIVVVVVAVCRIESIYKSYFKNQIQFNSIKQNQLKSNQIDQSIIRIFCFCSYRITLSYQMVFFLCCLFLLLSLSYIHSFLIFIWKRWWKKSTLRSDLLLLLSSFDVVDFVVDVVVYRITTINRRSYLLVLSRFHYFVSSYRHWILVILVFVSIQINLHEWFIWWWWLAILVLYMLNSYFFFYYKF